MSQENVEVVRRSVDHWNKTGGESLWELFDPDIEFVLDPPAWLAGTSRGCFRSASESASRAGARSALQSH